MRAYLLITLLLTGCGSFAWEDPLPQESEAQRRANARQQEAYVESQLRHQLADGSISQQAYDDVLKQDRAAELQQER
jgi:hypothetical protein